MRRCSATPSVRTRGSSSCTLRVCGCGERDRGENGEGLEFIEESTEAPRYAFFGVRSCELHAIAIQDRVFLPGANPDQSYAARREDVLLVAVNCGDPSGTCFCSSMGTGPKASSGYDLALTEVLEDGNHRFVVEVGTERGALVLAGVPYRARRRCRRA